MKVNPIISPTSFRKPAFKGYMTSYGSCSSNMFDTHGQANAVETTVEAFHPHRTYKIYYADPLEFVSDSIREKADYIVYDKEPEFPDINNKVSRNYFGEERVNYKQLFDNFRSYFYRLEMSDRKTVGEYENNIWKNIDIQNSKEKAAYFKSRIADAQYNQETAANCIKIYDDAGDLRYRKEKAEDEIASLTEQKRNTEKALEKTKVELERRKRLDQIITEKLADLENMHTKYSELYASVAKSYNIGLVGSDFTLSETKENIKYNELLNSKQYDAERQLFWWKQEKGYENPALAKLNEVNENRTKDYRTAHEGLVKDNISEKKELSALEEKIKTVQERIEFYKTQSTVSKAATSKLEKYVDDLPRKIQQYVSDISKRKSAIEKIKAELIPHFDKLKNYCQSRGVRVIR